MSARCPPGTSLFVESQRRVRCLPILLCSFLCSPTLLACLLGLGRLLLTPFFPFLLDFAAGEIRFPMGFFEFVQFLVGFV